MPELMKRLGRRATKHSYVILADKDALEDALRDMVGILECPACNELRACSVYETQCERIADSLSLLSVCQRSDGHWAWLAPEQVIELSRVAIDPDVDDQMRGILGIKPSGSAGGLKDSIMGMLNEELNTVKEFAATARGRLKRKVAATAGAAAGRAVDDVVDNVVNIGASTFKRNFRKAAQGSRVSYERDERDDAAKVLGVDRDASDEEIDAAWRKMAQSFHPDKNPASDAAWASGMMASINNARRTLKDR